jgi:hypothetical protein
VGIPLIPGDHYLVPLFARLQKIIPKKEVKKDTIISMMLLFRPLMQNTKEKKAQRAILQKCAGGRPEGNKVKG